MDRTDTPPHGRSARIRPQEAAVVRGMVLGDRSLIPEDLELAFQRSGITHVLAISGQHVAILAAMIYFVLRGFALPLAARVGATGLAAALHEYDARRRPRLQPAPRLQHRF